MAYVGTPIDTTNQFQSLQGKRFSGDGSTTAFTLDIAPSSVFDIEVFVENVRQDPNSAYGISGTTLTFTGAPPSGTNNIYVVHQAKAVGTINPTNDSVTASSIADDAVESEHLNDNIISGQTALGAQPADTDEFLVSDAGTIKRVDYSYIKGDTNAPSFFAYQSSVQTLSNDSWTKINYETEILDSDGKFASHRFTPTVAGKYFLFASYRLNATQDGNEFRIAIYKNGSVVRMATKTHDHRETVQISTIVDSDTNDYFEVYGWQNTGGGRGIYGDGDSGESDDLGFQTVFGGFRIAGT